MLSFEDFKKVQLKIARVLEVSEHPDADKLYLIQIEVGDAKKQIVAGIRGNYTAEELVGRSIVIVDNLEPAVIRGKESQGMLLAASSVEGPVILVPEKDVPSGSSIK